MWNSRRIDFDKFGILALLFVLGVLLGGCASKPIQTEKLNQARATIEEAKKEGASRYAPKSLAFAEQTLKRVEDYEKDNPSRTDEIQKQEAEAVAFADRCLHLTRVAKEVSSKKPEEIAAATTDKVADVEEMAEKKIASLKGQTEELSEEVKKNRAIAELHDRTAKARRLFGPDEADVFQDGTRVIIRLKTLDFPVGRAYLDEDNFPVLANVADALRILEGTEVTVEGHTDSSGTETKNAELSQKRADTVKAYLASTRVIDSAKLQAVGKGSNFPLASNATKDGRATNRRIDVVVETAGTVSR
jgi:outer membrane protein OmpA-like peptidoglycan-associated protein